MFANELGRPVEPRGFTHHFERLLEKAGLPKIRFHDMRHSFASLSLQEGVPVKVIQGILGHHSPAYTMATYTHITDKMEQEATEKIGNLLASCLEKQ